MFAKQEGTIRGVVLGLLVSLGVWAVAQGSLTPPGPPAPTMHSLNEIYATVSGGVTDRQGFCGGYAPLLDVLSTVDLFTVPSGKNLVILELNARGDWASGYEFLIDGNSVFEMKALVLENGYSVTFPDRCLVVQSGQTFSLKNTNTNTDTSSAVNIKGYYY
ncbi:MAG: hypothetical protein NTX50_31110 [Candidatus Sumerlaeota bacterium]|nr:hypothetical protein [Candidatus Sumerlaeota bacterium]